MTPSELAEKIWVMTNQEINEAVAKKLGFVEDQYHAWQKIDGDAVVAQNHTLPAYATSIEAAWEIVESTSEKDGYWMIHEDNEESDHKWIADIIDRPDGGMVRAEADTAPLAICEAFLKLP